MLEVERGIAPGVGRRPTNDPGMVHITLPTVPDQLALDAAAERDRQAERESLRPLLEASSVAVIGVSRRNRGIGRAVVHSLVAGGFTGPIYPVNPKAARLVGRRAYPSVLAIDGPVDVAVIAVPPDKVRGVIADCAIAGVRAAVILAARVGGDPSSVSELVSFARGHGLRIVGPNCIGIVNTEPGVRLSATFAPAVPTPGGLAVVSQSGAVGVALLQTASRDDVGVSTFVSLGDAADVSANDLLAYWHDDPRTRVVALYLESFGNPRRFAVLARRLSRRKPVLAVKSGRFSSGQRAGASHTGALATPDVIVDALLRQAGVLRFDTLGELLDAARLLADQPTTAGPRLGVVGNAGGLNILAADAAEAMGLVLPELPEPTQHSITRRAANPAGATNPVDLGADVSPAALAGALRTVAKSTVVDALVVNLVATATTDFKGLLEVAGRLPLAAPSLPIAVVAVGAAAPRRLGPHRVPVYDLPEQAVRALGHAYRYRQLRDEPDGVRPHLPGIDMLRARRMISQALDQTPGWQPTELVVELLHCYGVPVVETAVAVSADEAIRAAQAFQFPVAVKAADPTVLHKSDVGAVCLDVADPPAVRDAFARIATATSVDRPRVLVQPMVSPALEIMVGVRHDPLFGSLVTLGSGGVRTEVLADHTFRSIPLTDRVAGQMWRELRIAPLLTGFRGDPGVDTNALEDLLLRVGRLAEDNPEVAELDLNPVILPPHRDHTTPPTRVVDAKLRLIPVGPEFDGSLRDLDTISRSAAANPAATARASLAGSG